MLSRTDCGGEPGYPGGLGCKRLHTRPSPTQAAFKHSCSAAFIHEQLCPTSLALHQYDLLDLGSGRDPCFRYVLVYIELLTRHVWIFPLPTKEPLLVARVVSLRL